MFIGSWRLGNLVAAVLAFLAIICSCKPSTTRPEAPIVEMGFTSTATNSENAASPSAALPATLDEAQQAVSQVFADDVKLATEDERPLLVGDFNGDSSADIAIVVRPNVGKLAEINSPFANWSVQDPGHTFGAPRDKPVVHLPPPPHLESIVKQEPVLAIIHGSGRSGWRDPGARQSFLLTHAVGSSLRVDAPSSTLKRDVGAFPIAADVITESLA